MPFPSDVGVIDLMLQIPGEDHRGWYDFMQPLFMDAASRNYAKMPVEYMFRNVPDIHETDDYIAYTVAKMDAVGIARAMIGVQHETSRQALRRFPDRFFGSWHANPNRGMDEVRDIVRAHEELGIKAVTGFPSGTLPQVPIDDARWYPIYAKCVELDLPFCCTVGVPGPRIPMDPQKVERIDPVCWFFPELKFVMRHGAEPWEDLAVKLMLKYDNLFYMTSAFAPKHYPQAIVDYANTRGAHKILYAGYFPMGLSLERIFEELPHVPFRDHVWPRFLRDNALEVFKP
ncbi:MAG: amidohydrolase family protein [Alphaproteobacteria bacterium]|nr:amidohydrolase family protein [Alphaproteobacteria bacterium]